MIFPIIHISECFVVKEPSYHEGNNCKEFYKLSLGYETKNTLGINVYIISCMIFNPSIFNNIRKLKKGQIISITGVLSSIINVKTLNVRILDFQYMNNTKTCLL